MRSNTAIFAVLALVTSGLAAPLMSRPVARRSVARRSAQGILSSQSTADCNSDYANGSSWSEEVCASMPHVTGFRDATTNACKMPSRQGKGTGSCYIMSDKPISRVYRRLVPIPVDAPPAPVGGELDPTPSSTDTAPPPANSTATDPPPTAAPPAPLAKVDNSTTPTSSDSSATSSSALLPSATESAATPAPSDDPKSEAKPAAKVEEPVALMPEPVIPASIPPVQTNATTPDASSPGDAKNADAPTPSAKVAPEAASANGPDLAPPSPQAPFSTPKQKSDAAAASSTQGAEVPSPASSSPVSSSSAPLPTPISPHGPQAAESTPIPHGTEGTWGGTIIIGGSPHKKTLDGGRTGTGTLKLGRVVGTLFFDMVYGRFLF